MIDSNRDFFVICHFDELTSTQDEFKRILGKNTPPEWSVISAGYQTRGRGRRYKKWFSKAGENALFTVYFQPGLDPEHAYFLYQLPAVALAKVLETHGLKNVSIKYPNDILVNGKKIAGILVENIIKNKKIHASLIGIGLNVNQTEFPGRLGAVSVLSETGKETEVNEWIIRIVSQMKKLYRYGAYAIFSKYVYYWHTPGEKAGVMFENNTFEGKIISIKDDLLTLHQEGRILSFPIHKIIPALK